MYQAAMQQITNDRINDARQKAMAHRQAKATRATGPNQATRIASKATGWLVAAAHGKIQRPVFGGGAY